MAATDWDEATFEAHRPLLFSIAYRMLGSASEAEDVTQDAWLRPLQDERADVRSPRARQILTRAAGCAIRVPASPRRVVNQEIVRHFRHACVTGNAEALMAVLHADAKLVADGGGKAAAATRPVLGADRIAKFMLGYASKVHWSESDFELVTINGAPGLLMRHPISGNGTYSFDIADGRIRAIYVVRNPDKLRGFLEHTH